MRKRADTFQLRNRVNVGRVLPFSGRLTQPESSALFQAKPYLITSNSRRVGQAGSVATWPQGLNRFSSPTQCNRSPGRTEVDKTQAARPLIIGKYPLPFLATFTEGKKEIGKVERKRRERESLGGNLCTTGGQHHFIWRGLPERHKQFLRDQRHPRARGQRQRKLRGTKKPDSTWPESR